MSVSIATLTSQQASLKAQVNQLQAQINSLKSQISQLQAAIAKLNAKLTTLNNQINAINAKIQNFLANQAYKAILNSSNPAQTATAIARAAGAKGSLNFSGLTATQIAQQTSTATMSSPNLMRGLNFYQWNTLTDGGTQPMPSGVTGSNYNSYISSHPSVTGPSYNNSGGINPYGSSTSTATSSSGTSYNPQPTATATTSTAPSTSSLTFSEWNNLTDGGTKPLPPGYGSATLVG